MFLMFFNSFNVLILKNKKKSKTKFLLWINCRLHLALQSNHAFQNFFSFKLIFFIFLDRFDVLMLKNKF